MTTSAVCCWRRWRGEASSRSARPSCSASPSDPSATAWRSWASKTRSPAKSRTVARRRGLRSEVLLSLALLMGTAILVLGALLLAAHESHVRQLQGLAARSLLADAHSPLLPESAPGIRWWTMDSAGRFAPRGENPAEIEPAARALAAEAQAAGRPLLRAGRPWQAIYFAAPLGLGEVTVARLPPVASPGLLATVLFCALCVFTGFGAYVLRGSLVHPLEQLAGAARAIGAGELEARAPV